MRFTMHWSKVQTIERSWNFEVVCVYILLYLLFKIALWFNWLYQISFRAERKKMQKDWVTRPKSVKECKSWDSNPWGVTLESEFGCKELVFSWASSWYHELTLQTIEQCLRGKWTFVQESKIYGKQKYILDLVIRIIKLSQVINHTELWLRINLWIPEDQYWPCASQSRID